MAADFDVSRALLLTYVGISAAFVVLGSLILFTGLLSLWGNWRRRRAVRRDNVAAELSVTMEQVEPRRPEPPDAQLAAAIATAVAFALEEKRREQEETERRPAAAPVDVDNGGGWRDQGRIVAFDARRLRDRER